MLQQAYVRQRELEAINSSLTQQVENLKTFSSMEAATRREAEAENRKLGQRVAELQQQMAILGQVEVLCGQLLLDFLMSFSDTRCISNRS